LINPGEQTYTERFYMAMALSADASQATVRALPGIVGLVALVAASLWITLRLATRPAGIALSRPMSFEVGPWKPAMTGALWLLVFVLIAVPVASLVAKAGFVVAIDGAVRRPSWSAAALVHQLMSVPGRFGWEFAGTGMVASGAGVLALMIAMPVAWRARRGGWWSFPAAVFVALGLAIPGPLVGVGLIRLLNHDLPPVIQLADGTTKSWLLVLYDETPLAPMLAQAIRALPLCILLLWHSFATLEDDVLSAAALDGLNPWQVFRRIALVQRWRQVAAAWLVSFAIAAGDLAWAHLVTPPGLDLLSRRVFGLVHSGVEEQVAAISFVVIGAYGSLSLGILWLLRPAVSRAS
jgi:iron(III) transport system permease protein